MSMTMYRYACPQCGFSWLQSNRFEQELCLQCGGMVACSGAEQREVPAIIPHRRISAPAVVDARRPRPRGGGGVLAPPPPEFEGIDEEFFGDAEEYYDEEDDY